MMKGAKERETVEAGAKRRASSAPGASEAAHEGGCGGQTRLTDKAFHGGGAGTDRNNDGLAPPPPFKSGAMAPAEITREEVARKGIDHEAWVQGSGRGSVCRVAFAIRAPGSVSLTSSNPI